MPAFLERLFQADFLPHGWCYRWQPEVVWLHVVSDLLIALAYYAIPFSLVYIVRRRGDLVYPWMFWLFGAFILACGTTHLMSVVVVWQPWYRIDGVIKAITAAVSLATAILLLRVSPAIVALPSPEQLRQLNRQLAQEIVDRKTAEEEVRRLNADLEERVRERTRELERLNLRLRESENRMRAILDTSPALVYLKDTEGRYVFVNRGFERVFGLRREEVTGRKDSELFSPDAADSYGQADAAALEAEAPVEAEEVALVHGEPRTYLSVKFPLADESGMKYAVCGISTDITERKNDEQRLRQYNAELEQFAYVVSHDLQEPLRTVKSYTQLLIKRYRSKLDADADEFADYIAGGVDRMRDLITGLQSYSELTRRDRSAMIWADASDVLAATLKHMETSIREAGATVTSDPLPKTAVQPAQLGQVFQNLIGNAIKYRKPDEPPRIHVTAVRAGLQQEFVVSDNGIGIEMQYADQIFGVFRRLHGHEIPGTGIGLAICKKVVESHGGRIWVISEPGRGSEFHFTLPG